MTDWIALITVATPSALDEASLDALDDAAQARDATVTNRADGPGYSVAMSVTCPDPVEVVRRASRFALEDLGADLPGSIVELRVLTLDQYEEKAMRPDFPPLASATDAAEILGVSRQRVHQLAASNGRFPAPVTRVGTGPLWTVSAIEHFDRIWDRKPGRPRYEDSGSKMAPPLPPLPPQRHEEHVHEDANRAGWFAGNEARIRHHRPLDLD